VRAKLRPAKRPQIFNIEAISSSARTAAKEDMLRSAGGAAGGGRDQGGSAMDSQPAQAPVRFGFPVPLDGKIYTFEEAEEIRVEIMVWIQLAEQTELIDGKQKKTVSNALAIAFRKIHDSIRDHRAVETNGLKLFKDAADLRKLVKQKTNEANNLALAESQLEAKSPELLALESLLEEAKNRADEKLTEAEEYLDGQDEARLRHVLDFKAIIDSKPSSGKSILLCEELFKRAELASESPQVAASAPQGPPSPIDELRVIYRRLIQETGVESVTEHELGEMDAHAIGELITDILFESYKEYLHLSRKNIHDETSARQVRLILYELYPSVIDFMLLADVDIDDIQTMLLGVQGQFEYSTTKEDALTSGQSRRANNVTIKGLQTPTQRKLQQIKTFEAEQSRQAEQSSISMHGNRDKTNTSGIIELEYDVEVDGTECVQDRRTPDFLYFKKSFKSFPKYQIPTSVWPKAAEASGSAFAKQQTVQSYTKQFSELKSAVGADYPNTPSMPAIDTERTGYSTNIKYLPNGRKPPGHPGGGGSGPSSGGMSTSGFPFNMHVQTTVPMPCPLMFSVGASTGECWKQIHQMYEWHRRHQDQPLRFAKQVRSEHVVRILACAKTYAAIEAAEGSGMMTDPAIKEAAAKLALIRLDRITDSNDVVIILTQETFIHLDNPIILKQMYAMSQNKTRAIMYDDLINVLEHARSISRVKDSNGWENLANAHGALLVYIGHVADFLSAIEEQYHNLLPLLNEKLKCMGPRGEHTTYDSLAELLIRHLPDGDMQRAFTKLHETGESRDSQGNKVYGKHKYTSITALCTGLIETASTLMLKYESSPEIHMYAQVQKEKSDSRQSSGGGSTSHFQRTPSANSTSLVMRSGNTHAGASISRSDSQRAAPSSEYAARGPGKTFYVKPSMFKSRPKPYQQRTGQSINAIGEVTYDVHEDGELTSDAIRLMMEDEAEERALDELQLEQASFFAHEQRELFRQTEEERFEDSRVQEIDIEHPPDEEPLAAIGARNTRPVLSEADIRSQPCYNKATRNKCDGEGDWCKRDHSNAKIVEYLAKQARRPMALMHAWTFGTNYKDFEAIVRRGLEEEISKIKTDATKVLKRNE